MEKQPYGTIELDLEAGNLVFFFLQSYWTFQHQILKYNITYFSDIAKCCATP